MDENLICFAGTFRLGPQYHHFKTILWIYKTYLEYGSHRLKLNILMNSDESIRRIKPNAFYLPEKERLEMMSLIKGVSFASVFYGDTPIERLKQIKPLIYIKGGDYRVEDLPEKEVIESYGGRVVIAPKIEGYSTSNFEQKILINYSDQYGL